MATPRLSSSTLPRHTFTHPEPHHAHTIPININAHTQHPSNLWPHLAATTTQIATVEKPQQPSCTPNGSRAGVVQQMELEAPFNGMPQQYNHTQVAATISTSSTPYIQTSTSTPDHAHCSQKGADQRHITTGKSHSSHLTSLCTHHSCWYTTPCL
jgi:hypothetical protein